MRTSLLALGVVSVLGLSGALPSARAPQSPAAGEPAGEPAVELEVGAWLNHVGAAPRPWPRPETTETTYTPCPRIARGGDAPC